MKDIIIDIPLEKQIADDRLFEYTSFRKARALPQVYQAKVRNAFINNLTQSAPLFTPQKINKKHIVIKNIGNMKRIHLKNALNYTIEKSYQEFVDIFNEQDFESKFLDSTHQCAIDYLGNFVNADEVWVDWKNDFSANKNANEALHLVFSLNEVKSPALMDILLESTKQTLQSHLADYKYILVPHAHQNQPHIHIIINKTHLFTRKKLHFGSKAECADFFDTLREDFKQNLFVLSQGKLDYTNEARFDKSFRQKHLDSKIEALDNLSMKDTKDYAQDFDFLSQYKNAINSVNTKIKYFTSRNKEVRREIKNASTYLHNVERKLVDMQSQGKNPTYLTEKRILLLDKLSYLSKQYTKNEQHIQSLKEHIERFLDWEDTYQSFCESFTLHNKKKSLVSSFQSYEKYLPLDVIEKLNEFKRDVTRFENTLGANIDSISDGVKAGIMDYNHKSNIFVLSKNLSRLMYYKNILSHISFDENKALHSKKDTLLQSFEDSKQRILEHIAQRMRFVYEHIHQAENEYKQCKNMNDLELQKLAYLSKKIVFLAKELQTAKEVLQKYEFVLPFKDKRIEMLTQKSQTIGQTLKQEKHNAPSKTSHNPSTLTSFKN